MGHWHQMYRRPQRAERLEVKNGEVRFESLMAKKLSERDRKFAESLKKQFEDGGKLSHKQIECVEKMEQRYSPESQLKRERWAQSYKGDHRETALICARYYATTTYFRDLALKIATDEDFVPTEKQFTALTKNKYALKAIAAATEPPAFPVGSLCKVRANFNLVSNPKLHDQIGLVVSNHPTGLYARSTILVNGEHVKLEDRCLKAAAKKKK
jgi:hypothetical protein